MNPKRLQGSYTIQGFIVYEYRAPTFKAHAVLQELEDPEPKLLKALKAQTIALSSLSPSTKALKPVARNPKPQTH